MTNPLAGKQPVIAAINHPVWVEVERFFKPTEFRFPFQMDVEFLRLLMRIRIESNVPFRITSDHRPPDRNVAVGGATGSAHMQSPCRAVDLKIINNFERFAIVAAAIKNNVGRIGIYPAAPDNSGVLHLDASTTHPTPRIWTRY